VREAPVRGGGSEESDSMLNWPEWGRYHPNEELGDN
jgi:hypothetical protein